MRKLSLRGRLTLLYGGLFMAAGVVLLGVTYALFNANLGQQYRVIVKGTYLSPGPGAQKPPPPTNDVYVMNKDGAVLTGWRGWGLVRTITSPSRSRSPSWLRGCWRWAGGVVRPIRPYCGEPG